MLQLNRISYEIGDRSLFKNLSFSFNRAKYGLVGPNGIGKTTLMKILTGELEPTSGKVHREGKIAYFKQLEDRSGQTVGEYLNEIWESDYLTLIQKLTENISYDKSINQLSGGEWVKIRLAKTLTDSPSFIILDEPTNNLDQEGKQIIQDFMRNLNCGLILISHDREMLDLVDGIIELSNQAISYYGGPYSFYADQSHNERNSASENLEKLKREKKRRELERTEKIDRQTKRMRDGKNRADSLGLPRIILGGMKRQARKSLAKIETQESDFVQEAIANSKAAWDEMKIDPFIRFDFASHKPPSQKIHFAISDFNIENVEKTFWRYPLSLTIKGSERIWIRGNNGSGKTSLIQFLLDGMAQGRKYVGKFQRGNSAVAYLDQQYGQLNPNLSLIDNISNSSRYGISEIRNELAGFGFYAEKVNQKVKSFSGGELLKAGLAQALLGKEVPQLFVLDEPTNNLDLNSQQLLIKALNKFEGAIVLISHDTNFAKDINIEKEILLD